MSIIGIAGNSLFQNTVAQQTQERFQKIQSQFQKLGQDLQAGNLTQAQSDFATLTQELPTGGRFGAANASATSATSATPSSNSNSIVAAFQSLGKDLQSGNLNAAQQDFATIQQSAQQTQASSRTHHGHHHHNAGADSDSNAPIAALQQDFVSLGQALQSGSLPSAQQAYASLQSELQQFLPSFASISAGGAGIVAPSTASSVSLTA